MVSGVSTNDQFKQFDREETRFRTALKLQGRPSEERQHLIEEYQRQSLIAFAPATRKLYNGIIRDFKSWCQSKGHPDEPPIPALVVAKYVEGLGGKIRPNTIETRLWAIGEYHRANFLASPTRHRLVELALKAVKRTYGTATKQAPPLRKTQALKILASLGNSRLEMRDKAALWIASDSWCRASEIVAFRVRDLISQDDGSSLLFIARSKTDQYGQGAYAYLSPRGSKAVWEWIKLAQLSLTDPILVKSQMGARRAPLDPATISRVIKRITGQKELSAHSTRIGGVHDAFSIGCDLASIMIAGRWNSPEMPAQYGRRILASQSAAAAVCAAYDQAEVS